IDSLNKRVGINTLQPTASLHVTSLSTNSVALLVNQNGSSTQDVLRLQKGGTNVAVVTSTGATTFQKNTDSATAFTVLNTTGDGSIPQFTIDTTNNRVYVGNTSADATGALLVLDTKNTAADPTGVDGGMYYNSALGVSRCYIDSYWRDCLENERTTYSYVNDFMKIPGSDTPD